MTNEQGLPEGELALPEGMTPEMATTNTAPNPKEDQLTSMKDLLTFNEDILKGLEDTTFKKVVQEAISKVKKAIADFEKVHNKAETEVDASIPTIPAS